jgi:hypothetical protein
VTALEVCEIVSVPNYEKKYERTYSIVHERCANVVCNILNPQLPVRRTSTCLRVGGNDDRKIKRGPITFSAAVDIRVLNHEMSSVSHKMIIL